MARPDLERIVPSLARFTFPKKFAVETCAECNLACAMCHHPTMCRPKGNMPFPLWRRMADEISRVAPRTECWFSFCGEPLLEPDLLFAMLDYGRTVELESLNVNTNGMLLTERIADDLLGSGVNLVVIGIDGFSKEVYETVRFPGDRDTVFRNVEYLLAARKRQGHGPEIQIQFIEMDENRHEIEPFKAHWLPLGATLKIRTQLSWGGTFETSLRVPDDKRIPCPWAITMMHVFWDGRVPRCPGDTEGEEGVGNAWDHSLTELWARLGDYRAIHLERRWDDLPDRCLTCQDWMTGAAQRFRPEEPMPGYKAPVSWSEAQLAKTSHGR